MQSSHQEGRCCSHGQEEHCINDRCERICQGKSGDCYRLDQPERSEIIVVGGGKLVFLLIFRVMAAIEMRLCVIFVRFVVHLFYLAMGVVSNR